jgi:hypothetical protein
MLEHLGPTSQLWEPHQQIAVRQVGHHPLEPHQVPPGKALQQRHVPVHRHIDDRAANDLRHISLRTRA